jgi:membrane protease YdiL (CAAX protease family)
VPPQPDLFQLFLSLVYLGIEFACFVFIAVLTALTWRQIRFTWKAGLAIAVMLFVLGLPSVLLALAYLDLSGTGREIPAHLRGFVQVAAGVAALGITVVQIPLRAAYLHVAAAEWGRVRPSAAPTEPRPYLAALAGPARTRRLGIAVGAGVGLVSVVLTFALFWAAGVREGQSMKELQRLFPQIQEASAVVALPAMLGFVIAAAVTEELIFRGAMLGFLLRVTRNQAALAWVFITAVSALWALLHIPNTDHPTLKVMQIFLLGLALGGMTRRWGLPSAVAAHVTLNTGAVIVPLVFPSLT